MAFFGNLKCASNSAGVRYATCDGDFRFLSATPTTKYAKWTYSSTTFDVHGILKVHHHAATGGYAIEAKSNFNGTTTAHYGITSTVDYEPTGGTATAGGVQGLQGVGRLAASMTVTGGSIIGTYGQACNLGTINGSGVMVAGLYGLLEDGGTYTACSHVASLWVDSHLTKTISAGSADLIYATNNGSTTFNNALYIYAGNKITNLFTIDTASGMVSDATTSDYTFTKTRKIKVVAGGETGYLIMDIV